MEKKPTYVFALILALAGSMTLAGCSSSEVSDMSEVSADELPVVDAETDQLPDSIDEGGDMMAENSGEEAPTADGLVPEASVDLPVSEETPIASTEETVPTEMPANSPSFDAPPSMNESAPAPTAAAETFDGGSELYEVRAGDTLMKIAFMVYGDVYQWRRVLDENSDRISDPSRLVKGTQLKVANAPNESYYDGHERYLIKSGDTLGLISSDVYGTQRKWQQLWKMNEGLVKDPNRIYAGFFLRYTISEEERQEAERLKSMQSAPLAESTAEEPAIDAERNPSSFEEAKVPGNTGTTTQ